MPKTVKTKPAPPPALPVFVVRGQRVILDADLAAIYGVPTKVFNQAIKRNQERFPEDFAFQLTVAETANVKSQFVTSSCQPVDYKLKWVLFKPLPKTFVLFCGFRRPFSHNRL